MLNVGIEGSEIVGQLMEGNESSGNFSHSGREKLNHSKEIVGHENVGNETVR